MLKNHIDKVRILAYSIISNPNIEVLSYNEKKQLLKILKAEFEMEYDKKVEEAMDRFINMEIPIKNTAQGGARH